MLICIMKKNTVYHKNMSKTRNPREIACKSLSHIINSLSIVISFVKSISMITKIDDCLYSIV